MLDRRMASGNARGSFAFCGCIVNACAVVYAHGMPSNPLRPETRLSVKLSALMSRNQYTTDPAPVVSELRALAGEHVDLLAQEVGLWIGFYGDDRTRVLTEGLREAFTDLGLAPWVEAGRNRRLAPRHRTPGFPQEK